MVKDSTQLTPDENNKDNKNAVRKKATSGTKKTSTASKSRVNKKRKKEHTPDTELTINQQEITATSPDTISEVENTESVVFTQEASVSEFQPENSAPEEITIAQEQISIAVAQVVTNEELTSEPLTESGTAVTAGIPESPATVIEKIPSKSVPEFVPDTSEHNLNNLKKEKESISESLLQTAVFTLGDSDFGIDIMKIREIIKPPHITKVPSVPAFIEGVINLRGIIMPVLNLRKKMNLPDKEIDKLSRIIVVEYGNTIIGFIVDSVKEVLRVPSTMVDKAGAFSGSGEDTYIQGIIKLESGLVLLLNIEAALRFEH